MNRKLKSTLGLIALLLVILIAGGVYIFVFQRGSMKDRETKLNELKANHYDMKELNAQLSALAKKAAVIDSVLASRKFNIPQNLSSINFFNFVNNVTSGFSEDTKVDVQYTDRKQDKDFFYYEYKIAGGGNFNDIFKLVYAIEHSKELKKIKDAQLSSLLQTDKDGMPQFLVSFSLVVDVYYATNDRFATKKLVENNLNAKTVYDVFYPLIRNQIPPNVDNLLDVQGAKLLALIPEGAFLADGKGNTYLLWEGQQVYLGYLTKIDYDHNKVSFILNKGGVIEKIDLSLQNENSQKN